SFRSYWLLVWVLGGLGVLVLGRHLRAPPWGAAAVSVGFLFSGLYTGHAQATSFLSSAAFLPWVVWRIDAALENRSLLAAVQGGALLGLSALAGYPAFTVATSGFTALWVVGRWVLAAGKPAAPSAPAPRGFPAMVLVAFFAVAFLVLAPTYVGFFVENQGFTFKTGPLPRSIAPNSNVLEPDALSTFA